MSDLIIMRGAPAAGKSHTSKLVRDHYLEKGKRVSLFHWDDILYMVRPLCNLDDASIIKVTRTFISVVESILRTRECDVVILDGVFILDKEHELIERLSKQFDRVAAFRLHCPIETHLHRNKTRAKEDFLDEERVRFVVEHPGWQNRLLDEISIDTTSQTPEAIKQKVLNELERKEKTNSETLSYLHPIWRVGDILRYQTKKLVQLHDVPFYRKDEKTLCMIPHFDIPSSTVFFEKILEAVVKDGYQIRFQYIDQKSPGLEMLQKFLEINGLSLVEDQSWQAPIMKQELNEELFQGVPKRLKRTMSKLEKMDAAYFHKTNEIDDPYSLWNDLLTIDSSSWKYREGSHMQGLEREDLKYVIPVFNHPDLCSLNITYDAEKRPQAYSLMAKVPGLPKWYAIKWGATDESRESFVGIRCLLHHIESLFARSKDQYHEGEFTIDFWGREQPVYEQLKNSEVTRKHFLLKE